jgi:hypothetical protein
MPVNPGSLMRRDPSRSGPGRPTVGRASLSSESITEHRAVLSNWDLDGWPPPGRQSSHALTHGPPVSPFFSRQYMRACVRVSRVCVCVPCVCVFLCLCACVCARVCHGAFQVCLCVSRQVHFVSDVRQLNLFAGVPPPPKLLGIF